MINDTYGMKKVSPGSFSHKGKGILVVKTKDLSICFNYKVGFVEVFIVL